MLDAPHRVTVAKPGGFFFSVYCDTVTECLDVVGVESVSGPPGTRLVLESWSQGIYRPRAVWHRTAAGWKRKQAAGWGKKRR